MLITRIPFDSSCLSVPFSDPRKEASTRFPPAVPAADLLPSSRPRSAVFPPASPDLVRSGIVPRPSSMARGKRRCPIPRWRLAQERPSPSGVMGGDTRGAGPAFHGGPGLHEVTSPAQCHPLLAIFVLERDRPLSAGVLFPFPGPVPMQCKSRPPMRATPSDVSLILPRQVPSERRSYPATMLASERGRGDSPMTLSRMGGKDADPAMEAPFGGWRTTPGLPQIPRSSTHLRGPSCGGGGGAGPFCVWRAIFRRDTGGGGAAGSAHAELAHRRPLREWSMIAYRVDTFASQSPLPASLAFRAELSRPASPLDPGWKRAGQWRPPLSTILDFARPGGGLPLHPCPSGRNPLAVVGPYRAVRATRG